MLDCRMVCMWSRCTHLVDDAIRVCIKEGEISKTGAEQTVPRVGPQTPLGVGDRSREGRGVADEVSLLWSAE